VAIHSPLPVLRIGTRGGELASWQASEVARLIVAAHPEAAVDIRVIRTAGDREASTPIARIGGSGVFTREIETALQEGAIDIAVHSLKDLPTRLADGLALAAILERADPRDALVAPPGSRLEVLPPGTRIGTSSMRRRSQLLARHPQLLVLDVRGNVPTRIARLDWGEFDALVLARAGLVRLGLDNRAAEIIEPDVVVPAPGQGALAIESRAGDGRVVALLQVIDHVPTRLATYAERAFLARVEGGCQAPVGALGTWSEDVLSLTSVVASADGRRLVRASSRTVIRSESDAAGAGADLADRLLRDGAADILREIRGRGSSTGGTEAT
jgi:hydroxymethylbilane synthase